MWFCESLWLLSVRISSSLANQVGQRPQSACAQQNIGNKFQMRWRIFDLCFVGGFLLGIIVFRLIAPHFWTAKVSRKFASSHASRIFLDAKTCVCFEIGVDNFSRLSMLRNTFRLCADVGGFVSAACAHSPHGYARFSLLYNFDLARLCQVGVYLRKKFAIVALHNVNRLCSSCVAIKSIVYPDLGVSYAAGRSILGRSAAARLPQISKRHNLRP